MGLYDAHIAPCDHYHLKRSASSLHFKELHPKRDDLGIKSACITRCSKRSTALCLLKAEAVLSLAGWHVTVLRILYSLLTYSWWGHHLVEVTWFCTLRTSV